MSHLTDDILSHIDIVDVISTYVTLKKSGSNFSGLSPFQKEKTPSFMVSPQKQIFKDFSSGIGGNAITFIMEIEKIDFWDAIKILADQAHLDLSKYQQNPEQHIINQDEKEKTKRMHALAQQFFINALEKNPQAQKYLEEKRKLSSDIQKEFGIGYAPDSHYDLIKFLKSKGFTDNDIIDASLAKKGQSGDNYAFFRNRITFPICDHMGSIIAFGARVINPEDIPKYLNSGDHKGYDKSKTLYSLDKAKHKVKEYQSLIIVEGYMDVIALHRLGYPIGIATCGTSMTHDHVKIIKRYTDTVYLLFDTDNAGMQASMRALSICYTYNIFPKMLTLPTDCKDVDDLANKDNGKEIFETAMHDADDAFMHTFHTIKKQHDRSSPIGKQKVMNTMFGLIMTIDSMNIQTHYLQSMAEEMGLSYEVLYPQYKKYAKTEGKLQLQQQTKAQVAKPGYQPEREILFAALLYENFYNKFVETKEIRQPFNTFIETLVANLGLEHKINIILHDPSQKQGLLEGQVRWEKELESLHNETERLHYIKKGLRHTIQPLMQQVLKDKSIDHTKKQSLLDAKTKAHRQ